MGKREWLRIGQNIARIRKSKGVTLEWVAGKMGRTPQWLSNIERNRRSIESTDLYKISQILGVDIENFFKDN
ncbi:MAG TPA: transcriptional regulator [Syntrophomonas sp.]|jgi:transcriptional regulator with XRE-family HTH domain|nr:transcriptional regulator [Syntrophomonas sp.]